MAQRDRVVIYGKIIPYDRGWESGSVELQWIDLLGGEAVARLQTKDDGSFEFEDKAVRARVRYAIEINGHVGLPSVVVPDPGLNRLRILWMPTWQRGTVDGHVDACDGTHLGGIQMVAFEDLETGTFAFREEPSADCGCVPQCSPYPRQEYVSPVSLPPTTYRVWVNRGPAAPDFDLASVPSGDDTFHTRRNSGTLRIKLLNAQQGDRMRLHDAGGSAVTYAFNVTVDGAELVSLPCQKQYDVWVRDATYGTWKKSPSPPINNPCVTGSGSTYVEVKRPTW